MDVGALIMINAENEMLEKIKTKDIAMYHQLGDIIFFMNNTKLRNIWLEGDRFKIYLRKIKLYIPEIQKTVSLIDINGIIFYKNTKKNLIYLLNILECNHNVLVTHPGKSLIEKILEKREYYLLFQTGFKYPDHYKLRKKLC